MEFILILAKGTPKHEMVCVCTCMCRRGGGGGGRGTDYERPKVYGKMVSCECAHMDTRTGDTAGGTSNDSVCDPRDTSA